MLRPLHVDEVDDDDAAQIAQADLAHHLHRGLEVDLEHGLLEVALPHVLSRVDVDGHQGFRVVDDDVAAGLEPHAPPQRLVDLLLDAGGLEDRRGLLPELDARGQLGHEGLREVQALLVGGGGVDEKLLHVRGEEIADHAEGQVHLLVEQGRRAGGFESALHLTPEPGEELDVGRDLLGLLPFGDGADDETAGGRGQRLDDVPEALPLGVVVDAPGDAHVPRLRHVHDVPSRERDERGDARALGAERFLGDLDEDLLPLAQHVLDGHRRLAPRGLAVSVCARAALALVEIGDVVLGLALGQDGARVLSPARRVVAGVEEGVLLKTDVHEGSLHAGQDVGDDALVDVAYDGASTGALHVQLDELRPILHGETCFRHAGIDDDPLSHGSSPQSGGGGPR